MRNWLLPLGAGLLVFGASVASGFHFDDYAIVSNPALMAVSQWQDLWTLALSRPLSFLTLWLNLQAGGHAMEFHLVSIALHLVATGLAYACLKRMVSERAALAGALIFAVHPLQAEPVSYISARSVLLGAVFCLAALKSWLDGKRWISAIWFVPALLSEPLCAAFPALLLLLRWVPRGKTEGESVPAPKGVFQIAAMFLLSAVALAHAAFSAISFSATPSWGRFLKTEGAVVLRYIRLLIFPAGFTVDPDIRVPTLWAGLLAWAVVIALIAMAWRGRRNAWSWWVLAGLILLLPAALLPSADYAADRRMYLPMFAFAAAAGVVLTRVRTQALAATVAVALALLSLGRTYVWLDDARLWREAVKRAPDKARPKVQLARSVRARESLELLSQAEVLSPYNAEVAAEMGKVLFREKQTEDAIRELGRAIALDPKNPQYWNNRGVAMTVAGETGAAVADFREALRLDPRFNEARENLKKLGLDE
jgi:tetratricopeptide (TPR) repeat protein